MLFTFQVKKCDETFSMETFTVDKSFYDIGTSDLKELWDSDLVDPVSYSLASLIYLF